MQTDSAWLLLQLEAIIVLLTTGARIQIRKHVNHLETRLFLLEMLATWQLCACSGLLRMMVDVEPRPHFYLAHAYSFHTLHFYLTLAENTCNPAWTLLSILRKGISVRLGEVKIAAQFIGAFLAAFLFSGVWAAEINDDAPAQTKDCSDRIQTAFYKAFLTELVVSAMAQLSLMHTQSQEFRVRVNALAATVTALAYSGLLPVFPLLLARRYMKRLLGLKCGPQMRRCVLSRQTRASPNLPTSTDFGFGESGE